MGSFKECLDNSNKFMVEGTILFSSNSSCGTEISVEACVVNNVLTSESSSFSNIQIDVVIYEPLDQSPLVYSLKYDPFSIIMKASDSLNATIRGAQIICTKQPVLLPSQWIKDYGDLIGVRRDYSNCTNASGVVTCPGNVLTTNKCNEDDHLLGWRTSLNTLKNEAALSLNFGMILQFHLEG